MEEEKSSAARPKAPLSYARPKAPLSKEEREQLQKANAAAIEHMRADWKLVRVQATLEHFILCDKNKLSSLIRRRGRGRLLTVFIK